ncbi:hypothetical protein PoB_000617500 [Plakobranchus ocellatus]|uniref:Transmembrane protein n=1 Tax=Plakobranchus ocellatus TaxID=259542 RepID=A0AAV3Y984_9GAST|nr:hypothetical protein PoB_000617500 [Plakobranchus ocellatus]
MLKWTIVDQWVACRPFVSHSPECQATLDRYADHPCWNGEAERFVKQVFASYPEGVELLGRLHSCQDSNRGVCSKDECSHWCGDDDDSVYDGASKMAAATNVILLVVTSAVLALFR